MEDAPPSAEALFPSRLRAPLRSGCAWVAPIAAGSVSQAPNPGSVTCHLAGRLSRSRCAAAEHAMPREVQLKPDRAPQRCAERLPQRGPEHRLRSWDSARRLEVVTVFAARKPRHRPQPGALGGGRLAGLQQQLPGRLLSRGKIYL